MLLDAENDAEFFFLRPRDIAVYVGRGRSTWGSPAGPAPRIGAAAETMLRLGFAASTFRFAGRPGVAADLAWGWLGAASLRRIPASSAAYLRQRGVTAEVIRLDGAVETAVRLGVADAIADVVSTGGTLRHAGLEVFGEPLLTSRGGARTPPRGRAAAAASSS